jgi:hypothetical protein
MSAPHAAAPADTAGCARCGHEYGEHARRDGICSAAGVFRGEQWVCECPRFVWSDDVFTVEVES